MPPPKALNLNYNQCESSNILALTESSAIISFFFPGGSCSTRFSTATSGSRAERSARFSIAQTGGYIDRKTHVFFGEHLLCPKFGTVSRADQGVGRHTGKIIAPGIGPDAMRARGR